MHCQLQSPEQMLFDGEAKIIVARSPDGEFAVMDRHAPLLAALGPSPLRIKTEGEEHVFALSGGVLQVTVDGVTILAHEAVPAEDIDVAFVNARIEELASSDAPQKEREIAYLDIQKKLGENYE